MPCCRSAARNMRLTPCPDGRAAHPCGGVGGVGEFSVLDTKKGNREVCDCHVGCWDTKSEFQCVDLLQTASNLKSPSARLLHRLVAWRGRVGHHWRTGSRRQGLSVPAAQTTSSGVWGGLRAALGGLEPPMRYYYLNELEQQDWIEMLAGSFGGSGALRELLGVEENHWSSG